MASQETIIYVSREIERALGTAPHEHYLIVTNRTTYGESVKKQYPDFVTLIDGDGTESMGTGDLMKHPDTVKLVSEVTEKHGTRPYIPVFKNTARIEPIAREHGWTLINPPAAASEKIENKVSQVMWLAELERYLPQHRLEFTKNIRWTGEPFILQWAHGHTGDGTILISSETELAALKEKFPERRSRVTKYIQGPSYTVNVVATPDRIRPGNVSYQITGTKPFTDNVFSTVGNDWGLARTLLTAEDKAWMNGLISEVGGRMQKEFWRGLFGIDVMKDSATGKMYLIEINARQPASTTFESQLQEKRRNDEKADGLTTFEAHIAALLGKNLTKSIIELTDGAQIVQRVTATTRSVPEDIAGTLELSGFKVISYQNTEENADLVRVQSPRSIMAGDGELNDLGKSIVNLL